MKRRKSEAMEFTEQEIEERVKAALRGARIAGHKSIEEIRPKEKKKSTKRPTKRRAK